MENLKNEIKQLSSAEDMLKYFKIPYDEGIVRVNRLHIMKRMHDYLKEYGDLNIFDDVYLFHLYKKVLNQAYEDFTKSTAIKERVFKVHKDYNPENPSRHLGCRK